MAFACHFITVAIHPFADGNGRTVRLIQHLLLLKRNEKITKFVPSETSIMAECFMMSAKEVMKEAKNILKELSGKTPDVRKEKIIKFIKNHKSSSVAEISQKFLTFRKEQLRETLLN